MPVYEYVCKNCKKKFEIVESVSKHDTRKSARCPKCGGRKTERRWSAMYVETSKKS